MTKCGCVEGMECHYCGMDLDPEPADSDEDAWCDWVLNTRDRDAPGQPQMKKHILAHWFCAEGQIGVERG